MARLIPANATRKDIATLIIREAVTAAESAKVSTVDGGGSDKDTAKGCSALIKKGKDAKSTSAR